MSTPKFPAGSMLVAGSAFFVGLALKESKA